MQIIITGGAGFLGQLLAKELLNSKIQFEELVIADVNLPKNTFEDKRIKIVQLDLTESSAVNEIINEKTGLVFHLAAIVSSHAEKDFDLGWKVNVDSTRLLLEACRKQSRNIRFVFASSCAVFGGKLPEMVNDQTALTPQSSYGTQKAICELMVNDYSRKGFIDGRVLRLPTICVRPGKPNLAASSFVSSIIREPLNGEIAVCPVSTDLALWLSSPKTIIHNFIHAANLKADDFEGWRTINLPGIQVTVNQMIECLQKNTRPDIIEKIKFENDEKISVIVNSWPTLIDNTTALNMGFSVDEKFEDFITQYQAYLQKI